MKRDKSFGANFSRRTLMTSAMAGAFTVAGHPAAAQRCPPIPPARVKGPLVWMNMDQQDVDDAYDNDVYAFNSKNVSLRNGTSRVCLLTSSKVECLAAECTISSQYDFRCDQSA